MFSHCTGLLCLSVCVIVASLSPALHCRVQKRERRKRVAAIAA